MKRSVKSASALLLATIFLMASDLRAEEAAAPAATETPAVASPKPVQKNNVRRRKKVVKKVTTNKPAAANPAVATKSSASLQQAATPGNTSLQAWLKKMKRRIARTEAKHNQVVAVASVRGSESNDPTPLYWKGQKAEGPVNKDELASFNEAIDMALAGNNPGAKVKLETFITDHPNSPLVSDARETIKSME